MNRDQLIAALQKLPNLPVGDLDGRGLASVEQDEFNGTAYIALIMEEA